MGDRSTTKLVFSFAHVISCVTEIFIQKQTSKLWRFNYFFYFCMGQQLLVAFKSMLELGLVFSICSSCQVSEGNLKTHLSPLG